ncbi:MAG: transglycosylase domain-containing protein [Burkholderiaceae bacterium]|nr:transglycosylase domain-containing protein [Burkholderiaceae bacterium]
MSATPASPRRPWRRLARFLLLALPVAALGVAAWWLVDEIRTSRLQAELLGDIARQTAFEVEPGPSTSIRFPGNGPYDERLGYHQLPQTIERLAAQGFEVTAQARMSPRSIELVDRGLFATYREKSRAGLELLDCRDDTLFVARFPQRVYADFDEVPPLMAQALLFIENRELLDPDNPARNPAVEWDRLARASFDQLWHLVDDAHPAHGGSTLATQIEKYRHSPEGRTASGKEKLRQMASASLRAYLDGPDTLPRRRQIVVDYLNTVPLAARPGFGEVNGIGDGLWAWYGRDFDEVNRLLAAAGEGESADDALAARALAFKQALSLMIAQRRPAWYLGGGEAELAELADSHLRLLAEAGIIDARLRDAALALQLSLQQRRLATAPISFVQRKAANAMRTRLAGLLGVGRVYELDRFDLSARSTLDGRIRGRGDTRAAQPRRPGRREGRRPLWFQAAARWRRPVAAHLQLHAVRARRGPQPAARADRQPRPAARHQRRRAARPRLHRQAAHAGHLPEIVAALHERWSGLDREELATQRVAERDVLARWAKEYLAQASDRSLGAMLEAAMQRRYPADPSEGFFTGGGLHHFVNFDPRDDGRVLTVREALRNSVNLVFIRMMRDISHHYMFNAPASSATLLEDASDPLRREYLSRFADREGSQFLARFYRKYRGKPAEAAEELLLQSVHATPARLASVFYELDPGGDEHALAGFLARRLAGSALSGQAIEALHDRYRAEHMSLADRGYVAGVHPLELWLVGYLRGKPDATLAQALSASSEQRQEVYTWLFRTRNKNAQDQRIRSLLEIEAFQEVHRAWRRLGYPFESLTPSYATSIGASGDRPAALAELMGIIVNRGVRLPTARISSMVFARDTPYETHLTLRPSGGERLLPEELADIVRDALVGVVEQGTARRLKGAITSADGQAIPIGGKTGTGDHRFDVFGRGGQLISSRVVNRTATFAFLIGDRWFGTIMAYVSEPWAADYKFTSALPTQLLHALAPALQPLLRHGACRRDPIEPPE